MSFMQVSSSTRVVSDQSRRVDAAANAILDVAMTHRDMVLASLSIRVRLDSFTVVIKAIDDMISQLKQEQADEVVRHDTCMKDLDTNDDNLKANRNEHRLLSNSLQEAESQEATLQSEKEGFESQLKAERENSKRAGLDRKEENLVYQQSVADQRLTVFILHKAEARLHAFYLPKASLLSTKVGAGLEPPPDKGAASTYEKSGTAPGVLQLLANIIADATKEEATLVKTEQHDQDAYAAFVRDSNQLMSTLISNIEAHTQSILDTQATIAEFKESLETVDLQHDDLNKVKSDTHSECDYTLKYFKVRQAARSEEWTALENAKAILRGSDFDVAQTTED
jgi:chromosome segregation ATPase